jgi:hypothetical protein
MPEMSSDDILIIKKKHPYPEGHSGEKVFTFQPGWYGLKEFQCV